MVCCVQDPNVARFDDKVSLQRDQRSVGIWENKVPATVAWLYVGLHLYGVAVISNI